MLRIAVVEDDDSARELLDSYLARFSAEESIVYSVKHFPDAVLFLDAYRSDFDVVFMDVEMPHLLGTDAATRLREKDQTVILVFITNMAQYAIRGYEVDAFDYILKPVSYFRFSTMLKKILHRINTVQKYTDIRTPDGIIRIAESDIEYVKIEDHLLLYHTDSSVIESWDSLRSAEEKLSPGCFARISKSCIVSLRHISAVSGDLVTVGKLTFPISRRQKKDFLSALNRYLAR